MTTVYESLYFRKKDGSIIASNQDTRILLQISMGEKKMIEIYVSRGFITQCYKKLVEHREHEND